MIKFEESEFYKLIQDFFVDNNKKTFIQFLGEFYNRTEDIINKNEIQDEIIKELHELYLMFNENGIDENIVREKTDYFLENSVKIQNIYSQMGNIRQEKLDKNAILSMVNMGQDIKEAMTGGSVAIVGKDSILTENIVDKQVTVNKTSFYYRESKNLYDIS